MRRVLIIDDEPAIRFALRRWFERQGWTVDEASDGAIALELLLAHSDSQAASESFAVIICDLHMPGVSGDTLYARLQSARPDLLERLIFSTGDAIAYAPPGSVLGRHRHVLQKPFEFAALRMTVETIVGAM